MAKSIRTDRLLLRPLRADDAEAVFALFANWEVIRWLSSPPWPYTRKDASSFLELCERNAAGDAAELAIVLDSSLIGGIGMRIWPARRLQSGPGPFVGYWLGQPYWGNGYMTEAARGVLAWIFAAHACDTIYSGVFADNAASLRVQEKLGFVRDGETTLYAKPRGGDFPHVNTKLTRSAFEARGT
jgi:RimJ/RimL family protein N-acetyltransferase